MKQKLKDILDLKKTDLYLTKLLGNAEFNKFMKTPFVEIERIKSRFLEDEKYDLLYIYVDKEFLQDVKLPKVSRLIEKVYVSNPNMRIMFCFCVDDETVLDFIRGFPLERGIKINKLSF